MASLFFNKNLVNNFQHFSGYNIPRPQRNAGPMGTSKRTGKDGISGLRRSTDWQHCRDIFVWSSDEEYRGLATCLLSVWSFGIALVYSVGKLTSYLSLYFNSDH